MCVVLLQIGNHAVELAAVVAFDVVVVGEASARDVRPANFAIWIGEAKFFRPIRIDWTGNCSSE